MSSQEYLTLEKKTELEAELENLRTVKRKEIADNLEWAKSLGDLSENAEYSQAREDQGKCEARINELEDILQNAIIADNNKKAGIDVSSVVTIKKDGEKEEKVFTIVGSEEVDLSLGKISNESPIGMALLYKNINDKIIVKTPKGEVEYKILKVE